MASIDGKLIRPLLLMVASISLVLACNSTNARKSAKEQIIEDYTIERESSFNANLVDDPDQVELEDESMNEVISSSSLPLKIRFGKGAGDLSETPSEAEKAVPSSLTVPWGSCQLKLMTHTVQLDQYLALANGTKLKFKEGIPAQTVLNVDKGMELYFKMSARIVLSIDPKRMNDCKKYFLGRKIAIGSFHINRSTVNLLQTEKAPSVAVLHQNSKFGAEVIYVKWDIKSSSPTLVDSFGLPVYLETDFYRAYSKLDGSYFVKVTLQLEK